MNTSSRLLLVAPLLLLSEITFAGSPDLEVVTVTATGDEQRLSHLAESISVVSAQQLQQVSAVHISEVLSRVPGVFLVHGNGQEHLTAIRSPVLTGAGSCGAFAITEDTLPVRATGFCNVNQLFDINTEQAGRIDVLRGPGSVLYGSDAQHGVINVVSKAPSRDTENNLSLEAGPNQYTRIKLSHSDTMGKHAYRFNANGAHDGGFKHDSGFDQQKFNFRHDYSGDSVKTKTLISLNNLNQETAGYVVGKDAYKDSGREQENPNPEAFRDSQSVRMQTRIETTHGDAKLVVTPYLRKTDMGFMMHFLPGTPVEENAQQSFGLKTAYYKPLSEDVNLTVGVDLELTDARLKQTQDGGFSSFPAGKQYDYQVDALMIAPFVSASYKFSPTTDISAGLRYESLRYDYDNKMIDGDLAEDGSICINGFTGATGCRYTRPEDGKDDFSYLSANLNILHVFTDRLSGVMRLTRRARAPQATEMYRLQNGQMQANLKPETLDSFEIGIRGASESVNYNLTAFYMDKSNVIFQSADRLNLSAGKTQHLGLEYDFWWGFHSQWALGFSGTLAKHQYSNDVSKPGMSEEVSSDGNDIVSAPRHMNSLRLAWNSNDMTRVELAWTAMGRYYTDIDNAHEYQGHNLLNLSARHQLSDSLSMGLRVKNLTDVSYAERADYSSFSGDRYFIGEPRSLFVDVAYKF